MSTPQLQIDFISDIACPWCAVGLNALELAIDRLRGEVDVQLTFQPFELNPQMAPEGEDTDEHLERKYGGGPERRAAARAALRERGAAVGFHFGTRSRVWNTFDAHRLLHWAGLQPGGRQRALKHALLRAYLGEGRNPGARDVLIAAAAEVGLDTAEAARVIDSSAYGDEVRAAEQHWQRLGINAVPSVVIDGRHLIQGGQPPEAFEQALRELANGGAAA